MENLGISWVICQTDGVVRDGYTQTLLQFCSMEPCKYLKNIVNIHTKRFVYKYVYTHTNLPKGFGTSTMIQSYLLAKNLSLRDLLVCPSLPEEAYGYLDMDIPLHKNQSLSKVTEPSCPSKSQKPYVSHNETDIL
jgi:hypothetical protein